MLLAGTTPTCIVSLFVARCCSTYINSPPQPLCNAARLEYHVDDYQRHYCPYSETSASQWSRSWKADDWMFLLAALGMDGENSGIVRVGRELFSEPPQS